MFNLITRRRNFSKITKKQKIKKNLEPAIRILNNINKSVYSDNIMRRFFVSEINIANGIIISLQENGTLYFQDTNTYSNIIRKFTKYSTNIKRAKSITFSSNVNKLFIVYLTTENHTNELKCTSIDFSQIILYSTDISVQESQIVSIDILQNENLSSPAFIEFDDENKVILTRNSTGTYKIWKIDNMKLIFELSDRRIEEIRTSKNILLSISVTNTEDNLNLGVYDIYSGRNIITYEVHLFKDSQIQVLEMFDNCLFLKQTLKAAIIVNLITFEYFNIYDNNYISKSKIIICMFENFIKFFSLKGELIRKIENPNVDIIDPNTIHLSNDKNFLLIYWKECTNNYYQNRTLYLERTPNSKLKSGSKFRISNSKFDSIIKSCNNDLKSLLISNISDIFSDLHNEAYEYMKVFQGEIEVINLLEDCRTTYKLINSENSKIISNLDIDTHEDTISYCTIDTLTRKIYAITHNGNVLECTI
jgi:hypothetical protein